MSTPTKTSGYNGHQLAPTVVPTGTMLRQYAQHLHEPRAIKRHDRDLSIEVLRRADEASIPTAHVATVRRELIARAHNGDRIAWDALDNLLGRNAW